MAEGHAAPHPASNDNSLPLAPLADEALSTAQTIGDVIAARLGRRDLMKGLLAATAVGAITGPLTFLPQRPALAGGSAFGFTEIPHGVDETHHVAPGYDADILIRWGDPVTADAPAFDPMRQSAEAQSKQFGYNNDYIGFVSLPVGSNSGDHGLLCINHEYTSPGRVRPIQGHDKSAGRYRTGRPWRVGDRDRPAER